MDMPARQVLLGETIRSRRCTKVHHKKFYVIQLILYSAWALFRTSMQIVHDFLATAVFPLQSERMISGSKHPPIHRHCRIRTRRAMVHGRFHLLVGCACVSRGGADRGDAALQVYRHAHLVQADDAQNSVNLSRPVPIGLRSMPGVGRSTEPMIAEQNLWKETSRALVAAVAPLSDLNFLEAPDRMILG